MTPILGQPEVSVEQAIRWALDRGAEYWYATTLPHLYWQIGGEYGVKPCVAWVQSVHETGGGHYGRAVTPEHNNYCGLKIPQPTGRDDDPNMHARLATPELGVRAHIQHLALYAGAPGFPLPYRKLSNTEWTGCADPRHFSWLVGTALSVEDLGGENPSDGIPDWAPSPEYGIILANKHASMKVA